MKNLISAMLMVVLCCFVPFAIAQQAQEAQQAKQAEPKTKLEAFQGQTGTVVIKGYTDIGRVKAAGTIEIDAMEFTDAVTGRKQSGVLVEVKESGRLENTDRSFIDYDEVESLLKGLDYISKASSSVTKLANFESTYKTKGNFSATTFSTTGGKIEAVVKSGHFRGASVYISLSQLGELSALIVQAKQKLDSVK
jgi:hypothetical protein